MKNSAAKRFGFTLVELLVVIAIIGLLSTVAVVATKSARSRAIDAKRMANARQIIQAMQLYYNDNGKYPDAQGLGCSCGYNLTVLGCCLGHGDSGTCWAGLEHGCTALDSALSPYIAKLPDDPVNDTSDYGDAYTYYDIHLASGWVTPGPALHWGYDQITNATNCLGGAYGQWGDKGKRYWCALTLNP
jgi:prepilin-type N-terminal cleavage/methylation domain-containing protein